MARWEGVMDKVKGRWDETLGDVLGVELIDAGAQAGNGDCAFPARVLCLHVHPYAVQAMIQ